MTAKRSLSTGSQRRMVETEIPLSLETVEELCAIAIQGASEPESLTMEQVQEISWGFLKAGRQLAAKPVRLS